VRPSQLSGFLTSQINEINKQIPVLEKTSKMVNLFHDKPRRNRIGKSRKRVVGN
jgi:uncharacterized protein YfbU (UPF0304 family)